jgi:hypothetical protein
MSLLTRISRFNCLGSSAAFAVIALVATAAAGGGTPRGDDAARQNTAREVSESFPDIPTVRFDPPALKVAFYDAVCFGTGFKGGAR